MAANPEVVEDTSTIVTYRLHDKPPLPVTALLGLQHTLAMFVGNITPPIIVAAALGFDVMTTAFIISMTLFTAGLSTWIQAKKIGPIGSGMCVVQGTSFLFIPPTCHSGWANRGLAFSTGDGLSDFSS
ncbi:MAG: solute carrier family 23 protein [Bacillota bacterium]|jgi:xanthine permease XanP